MKLLVRACVWPLVASLGLAGWPQAALAEPIGTEAVVAAERPVDDARAHLGHTLARADVAAALRARGVDPAQVQGRLDTLSDVEAQALTAQIDAAPAGASDIVGTIVFIFVLLLITDILGFTKVFPFTRSVR